MKLAAFDLIVLLSESLRLNICFHFFFLFEQSQKEGRRHLVYNNNTFSAAILTADMKKKGKKMLFKVWVGQMFKGSKGRI